MTVRNKAIPGSFDTKGLAESIVANLRASQTKAGPSVVAALKGVIERVTGSGLGNTPEGEKLLSRLNEMLLEAESFDAIKSASHQRGYLYGVDAQFTQQSPAAASDKSVPAQVTFSVVDPGFVASLGGEKAVKGLVWNQPADDLDWWLGFLMNR